ncbi:cilia- and flagella-associated protein 69 [Odontesthes bonariensis]|uniref:cilia- and flagella-associated protein 69 n=1 Tax=Odontesthes bonariensis TaxID=219752 RepID=UPI003F58FE5A
MDSGKVVPRRKPDLPVISLREEHKSQHTQEATAKSLDLSKVVRLFEDPLTTNLKERHLFVLKKLLKRNHSGFLLRELTALSRVLDICAEKAKDHPEYVPALCEALKICRLPFLKERASDELSYAQDATEFISHIGFLMRVSDPEVKQNVVECVKWFYRSLGQTEQLEALHSTSPGYRLQLLERSDLPKTLLLSMATLQNQPAIKLQLLRTLQILSSSSDVNCSSMLHARAAEMICLHMNEPDTSGQVLSCSSEILWNLLERSSKQEVAAQLSSMECVVSLKEAFCHLLLNARQHSDLQLRNDLLAITAFIAEIPNSLLVESLFAKQLVGFVTFPELKSRSPLVQNFKFSYSNEDLKMRKLLLNLLVLMSRDSAALQLYNDELVMLFLLELVKPPAAPPEHRSGSHHWSIVQQEELQLQALDTLASIAPLMLNDYMSSQGNACLLLLLDWCVGTDPYFSQGHSFHATGGRGSKKAQMRHCIRLLRSVTSGGVEAVNQDLCDQGTIHQLLGILIRMEASSDEEDVVAVEIMSDIQLILSALCETDTHRKELFGSEGVEMAVHFLRKGAGRFYSGLGHNKLVLSTVDCVWSCVVGCNTTEDYFLAREGAFLLLNFLSTSPRCVHGIVLSTLLDLCDNPNTQFYILSWRDAAGQTAPRLLLKLWREQEKDLGVSRSPGGGITDPQRPILSRFQQDDSSLSFPANMPSAAVTEISENQRAKIYSILCCLGFQELPGLSTEDYVTLCIVKRYLDFKVGEVWDEICRELSLDGVRPTSPDDEAMSTICKISEDKAKRIMAEQNSILEQQQKEDGTEEQLMYTEMKSHRKQQELTAKFWDKYVSRTSNYEILKEEKAQRGKYVDSTRSKLKRPAERFIGHIVAVESTGVQGPEGVKVTLARAPIRAETAT